MVLCLMVDCSNRSGRDKVSFNRVPTVITDQGEFMEELTAERRRKWISAISRDDLTDKILENDRVCGGEHSFTSLISRSISHLEFFWVSGLSHLPFQIHKRYIRRIRTRDPMISRRTLSPLDYRTVAAEATENLWYLCTVAGPNPDPDPNPRGGGQLPNPKSAILR